MPPQYVPDFPPVPAAGSPSGSCSGCRIPPAAVRQCQAVPPSVPSGKTEIPGIPSAGRTASGAEPPGAVPAAYVPAGSVPLRSPAKSPAALCHPRRRHTGTPPPFPRIAPPSIPIAGSSCGIPAHTRSGRWFPGSRSVPASGRSAEHSAAPLQGHVPGSPSAPLQNRRVLPLPQSPAATAPGSPPPAVSDTAGILPPGSEAGG